MSAAVALDSVHRDPPTIPADPIFKHLRLMRKDPLGLVDRCAAVGDVVRLKFPLGHVATVVSSPDAVKHVLQDNHRNYDKQTRGFGKLRSILGLGLVTSEGELWLRQRRLMQPAFHRQRLANFASLIVRDTEAMAERWDLHARLGKPVDVSDEMMRLTLRIVGEALFSVDLSDEAGRIGPALTYALHHVNARITKIFDPPENFPTPGNRRYLKARDVLDSVVVKVIEERRRSGESPGDLLTMLLEARDEETGEGMNDKQLRDEVITLVGAGHETTANAMAWTFYALDRNPEVADRLAAEVKAVLGGRSPTLEDLPKLEYVRMVVDESMRLYPPVWMIVRRALEDDVIDGFHIPAKTYVMTPQWTVHRNPRFWGNPERFDPERFRKDKLASIPRYAHFPFGGGPRLCIGSNFALMEAQLILATLAQRFRPKLTRGARIGFDPQITLRPRFGMPMTIHPVA